MDRRNFLKTLGKAGAGTAFAGAAIRVPSVAAARAIGAPSRSPEVTDMAAGGALGMHRMIWSVPTTTNLVAITFDDGPDPEFTPTVLRLLGAHGVRATFNVMGWNALEHPALLKQAVAAGHEIGNHTWTHRDLAYESADGARVQLRAGKSAIEDIVETRVRFLRPPRGELTGAAARVAAELGYDVLLWSVTRGPMKGASTPEAVAKWVVDHVEPGDVLGLHDGIGRGTFTPNTTSSRGLRDRRRVEMHALPAILAGVKAKGLEFTTASALLDASTPPAAPVDESGPDRRT